MRKPTKNEKRRAREKATKQQNKEDESNGHSEMKEVESKKEELVIEIEYVSADYENVDDIDPSMMEQFREVFQKFSKAEELLKVEDASEESKGESALTEANSNGGEGTATNSEEEEALAKLSKKKKKLQSRLSVAQLKQLVSKPEIVEAQDVTAQDPQLLVYLKSTRNTVPVPRHWCQVRKYLQGKRGVEKVPFQLPDFIAETGIAKIRESVLEQEAMKKGKQKARDRVKPKMGKIDIDYQVLHDCFFKYQTKPPLSTHGDLYYEGKEFELNMKEKKPGQPSADLREALGMNEGGMVSSLIPPPWLINMQRYGVPPSYPNLRIPGLNAPLPSGAAYGYQPGGWGKPPVDEYGRPLYGDVFGVADQEREGESGEPVDKVYRWGMLEEGEEEEEEEEDEEDEANEGGKDEEGRGALDPSGVETPMTLDGLTSLSSGLETPDTIDLRKRAGMDTPDTLASATPRELYTVIQEKSTVGTSAGQMFGSDRAYVLPGRGDVQLSINPDELDEVLRGDKDKLKDMHDEKQKQISSDYTLNGTSGVSKSNGAETEESSKGGASKKRKADTTGPLKRFKDFKF